MLIDATCPDPDCDRRPYRPEHAQEEHGAPDNLDDFIEWAENA